MSRFTALRLPRAVLALSVAAAAGALAVHRLVFPYLSVDHDEPLYALQASWLKQWTTTLPGGQERFFRPWLSGRHGDHVISVFQPVWPAVLAVSSAVTGSFQPAMAAAAAAVAVLTYLFAVELLGDRRVATIAAAVVVASPFVWLRSGTMLAYGWSLLLELTIGVLVLRARRRPSDRAWVVIGLVSGVLAFTRPFDAMIVGVPIAVWLAVERRRAFVRIAALVALGAAPGIVLMALNNLHLTGSATTFPLQAAGGENGFGFGMRRIAVGAPMLRVTFRSSVRSAGVDIWRAVAWSFGSVLAVPVAALGAWRLRRNRLALVLLATVAVLFPFFNLFYWGNWLIAHAKDFLGPHYYLPLAVVLGVLVAAGLVTITDRSRLLAVGVTAVLVVASIVMVIPKIRDNRYFTDLASREWTAIRDAVGRERAVVVLPADVDGGWVGQPRPSMLNDRELRQQILFSPDRGSDGLNLASTFPDRSVFRLSPAFTPRRGGGPVPPRVERIRLVEGTSIDVRMTVMRQTDDAIVKVYVASSTTEFAVDLADRREVPVRLSPDGSVRIGDATGQLDVGNGLSIGVSYAPAGARRDTLREEQRFWTRVVGGRLQLATPGQEWWAVRAVEGFLRPVPTALGGLQIYASAQ